MNFNLIYEGLEDHQTKQLVDLKQRLFDTGDINKVPVELLVSVIIEFSNILRLKSHQDLGLALNPNAKLIDTQLAKMLVNILATIQQRDSNYKTTISTACGY